MAAFIAALREAFINEPPDQFVELLRRKVGPHEGRDAAVVGVSAALGGGEEAIDALLHLVEDRGVDVELRVEVVVDRPGGDPGLVGHRSVGGFRASMYNALELESVQALVQVMQTFGKKHG